MLLITSKNGRCEYWCGLPLFFCVVDIDALPASVVSFSRENSDHCPLTTIHARAHAVSIPRCSPNGDFVQNFTGHNSIVNCVAVNQDDVMVSGGDDGSLKFWDWGTGAYCYSSCVLPLHATRSVPCPIFL